MLEYKFIIKQMLEIIIKQMHNLSHFPVLTWLLEILKYYSAQLKSLILDFGWIILAVIIWFLYSLPICLLGSLYKCILNSFESFWKNKTKQSDC